MPLYQELSMERLPADLPGSTQVRTDQKLSSGWTLGASPLTCSQVSLTLSSDHSREAEACAPGSRGRLLRCASYGCTAVWLLQPFASL